MRDEGRRDVGGGIGERRKGETGKEERGTGESGTGESGKGESGKGERGAWGTNKSPGRVLSFRQSGGK